jgi:hypothetical protein
MLRAAAGPRPPERITVTGNLVALHTIGAALDAAGRSSTTTTDDGTGPVPESSTESNRCNDSRPMVGITTAKSTVTAAA